MKNLLNKNVDKLLMRICHLSVSLGCVGLREAAYVSWEGQCANPNLPKS